MTMIESLTDARAWLRDRLRDGAKCPCCTQYAKVYSRKIHAGMTRLLILAYRSQDQDWFHISALDLRGGSGDFAKFRYWGLIEPGDALGVWRVTPTGVNFVLGRIRVPSRAEIFNDELLALTGEPVGVRDVLGARFNYDELMGTPGSRLPNGWLAALSGGAA